MAEQTKPKCRYCNTEIAEGKIIALCYTCEPMLVHAAAKWRVSLEYVIKNCWSYGPDHKGCTTLMLTR